MKRFVLLSILLIIALNQNLFAQISNEENIPGNVILVTFDGLRWQDFFYGSDPSLSNKREIFFKTFFEKYAKKGVLLGDRKIGSVLTTGNPVNISLPEYQSLMSGEITKCSSNSCGKIEVETLFEEIQKSLKLNFNDLAVIASWEPIKNSAARSEGNFFVNSGNNAFIDSNFQAMHDPINEKQKNDSPQWFNARKDIYTYMHAKNYIKNHQPRFLFISFDDSDEWGHLNRYDRYSETLKMYDTWIDELITLVQSIPGYGENTTLIFTTDHGRGEKSEWTSHGPKINGSENIWAYIYGPHTPKAGSIVNKTHYDHLNFYRTIQSFILGTYHQPYKLLKSFPIIEAFDFYPIGDFVSR